MLARLKLKASNAYNNIASSQQQGQLTNPMQLSMSENIPASEVEITVHPDQNILDPNSNSLGPNFTGPDYKFSTGKLPAWAKKQITANNTTSLSKDSTNLQVAPNQVNNQPKNTNLKDNTPKGRWGQRLGTENIDDIGLKAETGDIGSKESSLEGKHNVNNSKQVRRNFFCLESVFAFRFAFLYLSTTYLVCVVYFSQPWQ